MERDRIGMMPIAVLAIILVTLLPQLRTASEPSDSSAAGSAVGARRADAASTAATTAEDACENAAARLLSRLQEDGVTPRFILATVPDPIDSQIGYLFDLQVDAIQRAHAAAQYLIDRIALPWECARNADKLADGAGARWHLSRLHEREPGIIVFRGKDGTASVLLLVGETPTWGVQRQAFAKAVQLIATHGSAGDAIRVLGPTLTGSEASLRLAIRAALLDPGTPPCLAFDLISGSASAFPKREFEAAVQQGLERSNCPLPAARFRATVWRDSTIGEQLYAYLRASSAATALSGVALLRESNTGYGRNAGGGTGEILELPFPMQIGAIRSAYEQTRPRRSDDADLAPVRRESLQLSLDDLRETRDTVPLMTPALTNASVELVLAEILATVAREDITHVGLLATDNRDKLFLARKLREYCPDVRLFTFQSDLLYTHPDYQALFEGMIVGSTYPLFNRNQKWVDPEGNGRVQFSRNSTEGAYNAALALLSRADLMLEYAPPAFASDSTENRAMKPPIWLTVIGHGAVWPLKVFADVADVDGYLVDARDVGVPAGSRTDSESRADDTIRSPGSFHLIFAVLLLLVVVHSGAGGAALWGTSFPLFGAPLWKARISGRESTSRSLAGWAAAAPWTVAGYAIACVGLPLLLLAQFASVAFLEWVPAWWQPLAMTGRWLSGAALDRADVVFYHHRATDLGSGLSPLLPSAFLAGALYLWGFYGLRRLAALPEAQASIPLERASGPALATSTTRVAQLKSAIVDTLRHPLLAVPLSVLGVVFVSFWLTPLVMFSQRLVLAFEGPRLQWVFLTVLFLLVAAVLVRFLQFIFTWVRLRRLLDHFTWHPLVWAFERLPPRVARNMRRQLFVEIRPEHTVQLGVQQLAYLTNHFGAVGEQLRRHLGISDAPRAAPPAPLLGNTSEPLGNSTSGAAHQVVEDAAAHTTSVSLPYLSAADSDTQRLLRRATCYLGRLLEQSWNRRPVGHEVHWEFLKDKDPPPPTLGTYALGIKEEAHVWLRLAEDLIALQIVGFIAQVFRQMRHLLSFVIGVLLLMLFTVSSYPVQPQRLFVVFLWTMMGLAVGTAVLVLVQMNRNDLLSRIGKTEPNRTTFDRAFLSNLLTYAVLPVLAMLAAQFPSVAPGLSNVLRILK